MKVMSTLLSFERLNRIASDYSSKYAEGKPFPNIVVKDFLADNILEELIKNYPSPSSAWRRVVAKIEDGRTAQFNKLGLSDELLMPEVFRRFFHELNSAPFIMFLEKVTGIDGLIPDPHLRGAGLHQYLPHAELRIHADFHKHRQLRLDRRLNLLLYLNKDWDPSMSNVWFCDITHYCLCLGRPAFRDFLKHSIDNKPGIDRHAIIVQQRHQISLVRLDIVD